MTCVGTFDPPEHRVQRATIGPRFRNRCGVAQERAGRFPATIADKESSRSVSHHCARLFSDLRP